jgi:hypothetical protein
MRKLPCRQASSSRCVTRPWRRDGGGSFGIRVHQRKRSASADICVSFPIQETRTTKTHPNPVRICVHSRPICGHSRSRFFLICVHRRERSASADICVSFPIHETCTTRNHPTPVRIRDHSRPIRGHSRPFAFPILPHLRSSAGAKRISGHLRFLSHSRNLHHENPSQPRQDLRSFAAHLRPFAFPILPHLRSSAEAKRIGGHLRSHPMFQTQSHPRPNPNPSGFADIRGPFALIRVEFRAPHDSPLDPDRTFSQP